MQRVIWEGDTRLDHYQVVDTPYDGRPARVLYSGNRQAAQSGVATDGERDLLFDYIQRMFELAQGVVPRSVLVVGGGVGTLPKALYDALPDVRVDVVEPDEGLTRLAYDYFDLPVDERITMFHTDGRTFLREHATRYDMIFVDAFTHTTIPPELRTLETFQAYQKHLRTNGVLVVNIISTYHGSGVQPLQPLYAAAVQTFEAVDIFLASKGYSLWLPQNFVLAAQQGVEHLLQDYVRHESVKPPEVHPGSVLYD
ncbi:MAG TPA: fused MFS/spermidine synthase [Candidatus Saccharimonadales bacterium]|nr:fused MFS/spermidine synthase [Candidatus Saccharimonadales bacterium]